MSLASLSDNLWFKYLFFQWMFKDVNHKDLYLHAAAIRHNQAHRPYLLVYLKRWGFLAIGTFLIGVGLEQLGTLSCVFFYTLSALCACTMANIAAAYLLLGSRKS